MPLTVCVDLDGCLACDEGWRGQRHIGDPCLGAVEALREMVRLGYQVVVLTCRCSGDDREKWSEGLTVEESAEIVREWLLRWEFPEEVKVWTGIGKPFADVYLDDRAVRVSPREKPEVWQDMLLAMLLLSNLSEGG